MATKLNNIVNLTSNTIVLQWRTCVPFPNDTTYFNDEEQAFPPAEHPVETVFYEGAVYPPFGSNWYRTTPPLPEPSEKTRQGEPTIKYIVDRLTAEAYPERDDLYVPANITEKRGDTIVCRLLMNTHRTTTEH